MKKTCGMKHVRLISAPPSEERRIAIYEYFDGFKQLFHGLSQPLDGKQTINIFPKIRSQTTELSLAVFLFLSSTQFSLDFFFSTIPAPCLLSPPPPPQHRVKLSRVSCAYLLSECTTAHPFRDPAPLRDIK